jgi:hypothetical protein
MAKEGGLCPSREEASPSKREAPSSSAGRITCVNDKGETEGDDAFKELTERPGDTSPTGAPKQEVTGGVEDGGALDNGEDVDDEDANVAVAVAATEGDADVDDNIKEDDDESRGVDDEEAKDAEEVSVVVCFDLFFCFFV